MGHNNQMQFLIRVQCDLWGRLGDDYWALWQLLLRAWDCLVSQYARLLHFDLSPVREHDIDIIGCPATVHARIVLPHLLDDQFT